MNISSLINHICELYSSINDWNRPADKVISEYFKKRKYLGSKDRTFILKFIYGIIRNKLLLEELHTKVFLIHTKNIFNELIYIFNLIFEKNELVNSLFEDYKHLNDKIFEEYKSLTSDITKKYSFPEWMIKEFEKIISKSDMELFLESLNSAAPITIRIVKNEFLDDLEVSLNKRNAELLKCKFAPHAYNVSKRVNFPEIKLFKKGVFEVQDEGSQLVTLFSGAKGNIKILDACAGAGGKALYLSLLIDEEGMVYAYDIDSERLNSFKKRLKGKGYSKIKIIESKEELQKLKNTFDLVVIDAPCTGSGTIRRNPDLKWRLKKEDILYRSNIQKEILNEYADYVKNGGFLLYITCSFFVDENEKVIDVLSKSNFSVVYDKQFFEKYNIQTIKGELRLYPHIHNTDGFTAFLLKKN